MKKSSFLKKCTLIAFCSLPIVACGDEHEEHTVHVQVTAPPPATATAGAAFDVSWEVHNMTHDDLHHTEIRYCSGQDVADCGMGDTGSYTSVSGTMADGTFTSSVTIADAGAYTLVAWCHVGEHPHASDSYNVDVQ
jgi:hypothetical protein